jgi:hypothetical protein
MLLLFVHPIFAAKPPISVGARALRPLIPDFSLGKRILSQRFWLSYRAPTTERVRLRYNVSALGVLEYRRQYHDPKRRQSVGGLAKDVEVPAKVGGRSTPH